jgi:hypothetical protein
LNPTHTGAILPLRSFKLISSFRLVFIFSFFFEVGPLCLKMLTLQPFINLLLHVKNGRRFRYTVFDNPKPTTMKKKGVKLWIQITLKYDCFLKKSINSIKKVFEVEEVKACHVCSNMGYMFNFFHGVCSFLYLTHIFNP